MLDDGVRHMADHFRVLARSSGQPLVLVFARDWGVPSTETLDAIRAELRGLGAALLVVGAESLFCFRPDDELEVVEPTKALIGGVRGLREHYGVGREKLAGAKLTLCLQDDTGVRFRGTAE